jgi:hypothetical protein
MNRTRLTRRDAICGALAAGAAGLAACGRGGQGGSSGRVYQMGERVQVGNLIYTVLETAWLAELQGATTSRLPKNKFLRIQMTIFNSSNRELSVPMMGLEDPEGIESLELSDGDGVSEWLGILRHVNPSETLQGSALFDVKQGEYKLRVSDGGEPEKEITALVHIPLILDETKPIEPAQKIGQ